MKIELSKFEVELLDQALDAWESEPNSRGMLMSFMRAALSPKDKEPSKESVANDIKAAAEDVRKRRIQAALLRAKLLQSLAVDSEHSIFQEPKPAAS